MLFGHALSILLVVLSGADGPAADPSVAVGGEVERPLRLSAANLAAMPRQSVRARDHKGEEATFEGVAVSEILKKAGARVGDRLKGEALADYLVVEATDGYRAVFALPELDPGFADRVVLLADRRDGRPMAGTEGPFRVVVPGEKKHARWVRQVTGLTVRRTPPATPR